MENCRFSTSEKHFPLIALSCGLLKIKRGYGAGGHKKTSLSAGLSNLRAVSMRIRCQVVATRADSTNIPKNNKKTVSMRMKKSDIFPTTRPKKGNGLLRGCQQDSLFRFVIYYNTDHPVTGTQVISTLYSNDLSFEREDFISVDKTDIFRNFNGVIYISRFIKKLIDQGQFWHLLITDNHLKGEGGLPLLYVSYPAPLGSVKKFTTAQTYPATPTQNAVADINDRLDVWSQNFDKDAYEAAIVRQRMMQKGGELL